MRRILIVVFGVSLWFTLASMVAPAEKDQAYYVCNCKDDCTCKSISKNPGKCTCGADLVAVHFLSFEKDNAVFCRCGADCVCERSKTDPGKCGCGKPVKVVSVKGKYICGCGAGCNCGTISDEPGKCRCGEDLKPVS